MIHISCDLCGRDLYPGTEPRFVVKTEVIPAFDPSELTEDDLDTDHLQELSQVIQQIENGESEMPLSPGKPTKFRFDLCADCHARFIQDPLGRETTNLDFSQN